MTYNFTDGIKNALEGELDTAYTKISSGESYTLTGTLTGDTAIFPPSADGGNCGSENGTENPGDGNKEGLNPLAYASDYQFCCSFLRQNHSGRDALGFRRLYGDCGYIYRYQKVCYEEVKRAFSWVSRQSICHKKYGSK